MNDNNLKLRPATMADAALLLQWRNGADTRVNSRNSEPIDVGQHETWLSRILASPDHVVRIAEAGGHPVGVVRADRTAQGWELSWTVAPKARGRGVGGGMLGVFVASLDGRLTAVIRKGNLASSKIAAKVGLELTGSTPEDDFELWSRE